MKKSNVAGLIVIALFVIGIAVALMQYKREQTALEQPEVGEEPETVVLSADENPFGVEIKKINENYDLTKNYYKNYDLTKNYYKNYDNNGLEKFVIPNIAIDERTYIAELRESGYCQYGYIEEEDNIIAEMTEQQKEDWLNYTVNDINRIIGQGEEGFYSFKFTRNYEELQLEISKEILNGKTTTHTALVMSLIYDSEIYQVLNGKTDWAIHIVGKDLETGGELMNINFPEEGYHISIENWDNM